jgi:Domain of unknown function (DUF5600)
VHLLAAAEFPDAAKVAETMSAFDLTKLPRVTDKALKAVDIALTEDIPAVVKQSSDTA